MMWENANHSEWLARNVVVHLITKQVRAGFGSCKPVGNASPHLGNSATVTALNNAYELPMLREVDRLGDLFHSPQNETHRHISE